MSPPAARPFIKWCSDIRIEDVPLVGGKNASLGEMVRELAGKGVRVPDGFAITESLMVTVWLANRGVGTFSISPALMAAWI